MHLACFGVRVLSQICCIAAAASDFAVAERVFLQACLWLFQPPLLPLKKNQHLLYPKERGSVFIWKQPSRETVCHCHTFNFVHNLLLVCHIPRMVNHPILCLAVHQDIF